MKKLAAFVFAMLLTASLSYAQAGTDNKPASDKTASSDSGKKGKSGKKAKKSKKSKKGSSDSSSTPSPK